MINSRFFAYILFLFGFIFLPITGQAAFLNSDLKIGSTGQEVKLLQILLNRNPATQVATSGLGSPGKETTFFGRKTLLAMRRFQKLNQITREGFRLGPKTRAKLNEMINSLATSGKTSPSTKLPFTSSVVNTLTSSNPLVNTLVNDSQPSATPSAEIKVPTISSLSNINVTPGQSVMISGRNFIPGSQVFFGETAVSASIDSSGGTINCQAPANLGAFMVSVRNAQGDSRIISPIFIVVSSTVIDPSPTSANEANVTKTAEILGKLGVYAP
ncbi:MAG: peptidoglycan-binding domain-containing protein [Candidatus Paceibacterota bacterium]